MSIQDSSLGIFVCLDRMFASRAVRSTPGGHGYISSGKFISPRQINQDENGRDYE